MSKVKCHSCGWEIPLESARSRGGMRPGFLCGRCYGHECVKAFLVVGLLAVIVGYAFNFHAKNQRNQETQAPRIDFHAIYNAHYSNNHISTEVRETVTPHLSGSSAYQSNWQDLLFERVSSSELQRVGFGFTDILLDKQSVGAICGPQTPDTVTVLVKAKHQNYRFFVTQKKSAQ
jgi:hypothetical protein